MARRYEAIVGLLGGQAKRDGLLATPVQAGRSMRWATKGYRQDPLAIMESAVSDEARSEMILVKRIELYSTCEHHRLPFFGKAHVASIPDGKIVGLSKIPRVVEVSCASLAGAGAAYGADRGRTCGEEVTTMTGKAVFSSNIFEFVLCVALVFIPLREARKF